MSKNLEELDDTASELEHSAQELRDAKARIAKVTGHE